VCFECIVSLQMMKPLPEAASFLTSDSIDIWPTAPCTSRPWLSATAT
jgi:hypothetical protein